MGGLLSLFWGTPAPAVEDIDMDVPDKTTGLSGRERREVVDSWALVKKDVRNTGIELFMQFFGKHPGYQARFSAFNNVPLEKLRDNRKLMAHAMSVMYAITAVVDNLNDPECLIEMLNLLGTNHARRKIPEQAFLDLKAVMLQLLKARLGAALTAQGAAAWDKTLNVAYSVIFKGMNDFNQATTSKSKPT